MIVLSLALAAACGESAAARDTYVGAPEASEVASLEESRGDVRYRAARNAVWTKATAGEGLVPDDAVQTMTEARAVVRFRETDSLARLGPSTTLRIPAQAPRVTRLTHVSGQLVARLGGAGDAATRMEVDLPPGTLVLESADDTDVEARLEVAPEQTQITMIAGSARLDRARGEPLRIERGHYVELLASGEVTDRGRAGAAVELIEPADGATARTRDHVRFAWEPLPGVDGYRLVASSGDRTVTHDVAVPQARIEVGPGEHTWSVRGIIGGEALPASASRRVTVEVDRAAPQLALTSPAPGAAVTGPVVVAGRTEPGAVVEVDGTPAAVDDRGYFEVEHRGPRGLVNVVVRAVDDLGNARIVSRTVLRE